MSDFVHVPRFKCDLCDEVRAGNEPSVATLVFKTFSREFHMCSSCYAPSNTSASQQDVSIFKKAWNKFLGKKP
jgi:hypothetical protein